MNLKMFLLLLFLLSTVPNLGFYAFPSVLVLIFILLSFLIGFKTKKKRTNSSNDFQLRTFLLIILFYSFFYYGGLYQETRSIFLGQFFFGMTLFLLVFNLLGSPLFFLRKISLPLVILTYLFLSLLTILNSPNPPTDSFSIIKEAPLKLLMGQNPYQTLYSQVYPGIIPNYFPYLPFIILYVMPFQIVFGDPRFGIIFAQLLSAFVLVKLLKKDKRKPLILIIFAFLFFPRSFFILEHMYFDTIIFSFFLLSLYFEQKKRLSLSSLMLGLFFSFKQHLIILLPLFLAGKKISRNFFWLIFPAIIPILFFLINPSAFLGNTVFFWLNSSAHNSIPIDSSLTLITFFRQLTSFDQKFIYFGGVILFLAIYLKIFKNNWPLPFRIGIIMMSFHFLTYQNFMNHQYFIAQFLFLDLVLENSDFQKINQRSNKKPQIGI